VKVVYVAGPFTAPTPWAVELNVRHAEDAGLYAAECGAMPIIPHANTRFFNGLLTPEFWYDGTMELLRRADAVLLVEGWEHSKGARLEVIEAEKLGIPVFFFGKSESEKAFEDWVNGKTGT
jgi:hypothetical protein